MNHDNGAKLKHLNTTSKAKICLSSGTWIGFVCIKNPFQQLDSLETDSTLWGTSWSDYQRFIYRLFLAGGWRHRSSSPQPWSCPVGTAGFTPSHPKELLARIHPQTKDQRSFPHGALREHGPTSQLDSRCFRLLHFLGKKKSSKGTRQVALFPSYTKERSGGSPCSWWLLRSLLFITRGPGVWAERTLESSQP